jgi:hypothetical protein
VISTITKTEKWADNTYQKVAWNRYKKMFVKHSRPRQLTYANVSHHLLQTNYRNHRFYRTFKLCDCCGKEEESFSHILLCASVAVATNRNELLVTLDESLQDFGTPDTIKNCMLHGVQSWIAIQQGVAKMQRSPTAGQVSKEAATLADAYYEQTYEIGWESFQRRRLSLKWGAALLLYGDYPSEAVELWLSDTIRSVLDYTLANREFRNGEKYGHDKQEVYQKALQDLKEKVHQEYELYRKDPFIVSQNKSHLFDACTLHQRQHQDRDLMACWLADVEEAKQSQQRFRERAAAVAKTFFLPRRHSSTPREDSETCTLSSAQSSLKDSLASTKTYASASLATHTYGTAGEYANSK